MKFNTKTIHGGQENIDPAYGAVVPPIYQTSTYSQTTPGEHKGFGYSRSGNPTGAALEKLFAGLENGVLGLRFGGGEAPPVPELKLLNPVVKVLAQSNSMEGTIAFSHQYFQQFE